MLLHIISVNKLTIKKRIQKAVDQLFILLLFFIIIIIYGHQQEFQVPWLL